MVCRYLLAAGAFLVLLQCTLSAESAAENQRIQSLCERTAICEKSSRVYWGLFTYGSVRLESSTGCPLSAYYEITGFNAREAEELVGRISRNLPEIRLSAHQRYRFFQVTPSDPTGCSDLSVLLVMTHL